MSGLIRIRAHAFDLRRVLARWQSRHRTSGAVHFADPSTLLMTADTSVEALEDLLHALHESDVELEIIWREPEVLQA